MRKFDRNYLHRTWIVKILKRYGLMNRTEFEALRESEIHRMIKEYNLIQKGESKGSSKARKLIVESVEDWAKKGIITLTPVKPIMKVVKNV